MQWLVAMLAKVALGRPLVLAGVLGALMLLVALGALEAEAAAKLFASWWNSPLPAP